MKRKNIFRAALILVAIGLITGGLVYQFVINKPHLDYGKAKPAFIVSADDLFNSYQSDRKQAENKYNGQIVLLKGKMNKIDVAGDIVTGVFVFDQGMFGDEGIRCSMLPEQASNLKTLPEGSEVQLKGFLTGYNDSDIILEHCSVIR